MFFVNISVITFILGLILINQSDCAQIYGYSSSSSSSGPRNFRRDRLYSRWRVPDYNETESVYSSHSRLTDSSPDYYESREASSTRRPRSKPIVFPTSSPILTTTSTLSTVINSQTQPSVRSKVLLPDLDENGLPKCVKNPSDTFCEQVDNYPRSDYGLNLEEFRDIFGVKEIDARKSYFDDDIADERICGGPRKIVFPKMARTQSKRWVYIVNDDENFRQSVVTEICSRAGKPCAYLEDDNLPSGLSSQCRQKYARARLMALHPTEQRTYPEYFEFPSCCACYIKNPYSDRSKFRQ